MAGRGKIQVAIEYAWENAQAAQNGVGNLPAATINFYANLSQTWSLLAQTLLQVAQLQNSDFDTGE